MPSPFPGMDPYLEGSEWGSIQVELSSEIARQLATQLRPKYIVRANRRFITETWDDIAISTGNIYPDVSVSESPWGNEVADTAPVLLQTPLQMITFIPETVAQVMLEIRDVAQRQLVTAIEILSPINKRGASYQEYLTKRQRILHSSTHLIEIDLLRQGKRIPMQQPLPHAPYFVFLSRSEKRPIIDVWPIQLTMSLPTIPVPLLPGDADATLDLQLAFNTIYDALGYDLAVNYRQPPEIPLTGQAKTWVEAHLQQQDYTS